ncbi:hypothetical protein NA57DRAFT_70897 [Rhizodiscina lignyota]|uniref:Uncharacterized protein n=1 Tax=Rhizodiscina lignyota TaxID=1504668 RepID=A0A9P4IRW5_9PEZI|nr:hypothetical protein NA57DRAFT_70897 [Rhizodiscina lignyota]
MHLSVNLAALLLSVPALINASPLASIETTIKDGTTTLRSTSTITISPSTTTTRRTQPLTIVEEVETSTISTARPVTITISHPRRPSLTLVSLKSTPTFSTHTEHGTTFVELSYSPSSTRTYMSDRYSASVERLDSAFEGMSSLVSSIESGLSATGSFTDVTGTLTVPWTSSSTSPSMTIQHGTSTVTSLPESTKSSTSSVDPDDLLDEISFTPLTQSTSSRRRTRVVVTTTVYVSHTLTSTTTETTRVTSASSAAETFTVLNDEDISEIESEFLDHATSTTSSETMPVTSMPLSHYDADSLKGNAREYIDALAIEHWFEDLEADHEDTNAIAAEIFLSNFMSVFLPFYLPDEPTSAVDLYPTPPASFYATASSSWAEMISHGSAMTSIGAQSSLSSPGSFETYLSHASEFISILERFMEARMTLMDNVAHANESGDETEKIKSLLWSSIDALMVLASTSAQMTTPQTTSAQTPSRTLAATYALITTTAETLGTMSAIWTTEGVKPGYASMKFIPTATSTVTTTITSTITVDDIEKRNSGSFPTPYIVKGSHTPSMVTLTTRMQSQPEPSIGGSDGDLGELFEEVDSPGALVIFHDGDIDIEYNTGLQKRGAAPSATFPSHVEKTRNPPPPHKDEKGKVIIVDDGHVKVQVNNWGPSTKQ